MRGRQTAHWGIAFLASLVATCSGAGTLVSARSLHDSLAVAFDGLRGQVEVGGPFAGVEFHDSRPVPARISFYYPVANSIDLSTDYWRRGESRPFTIVISVDGRADTLGAAPWSYEWTPYRVVFSRQSELYDAEISYRFAEELPVVAVELSLQNRSSEPLSFRVETRLEPTLRTSHAYRTRKPDRTGYADGGSTYVASFDAPDTQLAELFVLNAGAAPVPSGGRASDEEAVFRYQVPTEPGQFARVAQIVGMGRQSEGQRLRSRILNEWEDDVAAYEDGIRRYVREAGRFNIEDPVLTETTRLARALLRADRHYLDGQIVPMPSPAEYNFFFTHDLLLTDLGAVYFDPERVRTDLRYVQSLVEADSILPHARYWRDSTFVVEFANADNWNHLWATILTASYLKHSGDTETASALYPTLRKSMALMLTNERDGLMYAERPDWWDIGSVYGPRAYLTALTIRALESYAYISLVLGREDADLVQHVQRVHEMRGALVKALWDDSAGYLLNGLNATTDDRHYYSGSLVAAAFDLLDSEKREVLVQTARRELLDEALGIRNAMPADFHLYEKEYRFLEGEVGGPFLYLNGGIWPQGNAWYAVSLLKSGRVEEARDVLARYLSVRGVIASPNGQPAFYEYRNANPESPAYGAVDKPTFLWAGGWFLHVLYQLAGLRESPWNVSFSPLSPKGFETAAYELALLGERVAVSSSGEGDVFRSIRVDGREVASAVMSGPARRVALERGTPEAPYLAAATCIVEEVRREEAGSELTVLVQGVAGQEVSLAFVSPARPSTVHIDGKPAPDGSIVRRGIADAHELVVAWRMDGPRARVTLVP